MKKNCWDVKQCGRQPGGARVSELGICPAATARQFDGLNGGIKGGRVCWFVAGTFCGGKAQGTFAQKRLTCMSCDYYLAVKAEEGKAFVIEPRAVSVR